MNTTFDKHRFMLLLKWETMTSKKKYIRQAITMAILLSFLFCSQLLHIINRSGGFEFDYEQAQIDYQWTNVNFIVMIFSVYMTFVASNIFRNMSTKQQRISYMMQPASNLEKFVVRFLHVTIGYGICFVVALAAADLLQFLLSFAAFRGNSGSLIYAFGSQLYNSLTYSAPVDNGLGVLLVFGKLRWIDISAVFTLFMLNHSFWIFCGTLYRRNPLFFTLCTQFALMMLVGSFSISFFFDYMDYFFEETDSVLREIVFFLSSWAIIFVLYWGAYRLFCRMQVVNNKWLNV